MLITQKKLLIILISFQSIFPYSSHRITIEESKSFDSSKELYLDEKEVVLHNKDLSTLLKDIVKYKNLQILDISENDFKGNVFTILIYSSKK